jgi:probable rRNA maturation factor
VRKVVAFLLVALKIQAYEVIFHFVTEEAICKIHKNFFNDPTPTDCITFPLDPPGPHSILGEAFVCPKTALNYATENGIDPYEELYRYVIHCLLHLIGYDDITPSDRIKMKRKEKCSLDRLRDSGLIHFKNPLRQTAASLK